MSAPLSSLIAEMFLQHTKHQHMAQLSTKHKIINYFHYVDDILIIFDPNHSILQAILADFNTLYPKLVHSRSRKEQRNKLSRDKYPQNPLQLENSSLQEAHVHRHHKPIHI
jgi:hypothetical protein